jgi:hypothetical protein
MDHYTHILDLPFSKTKIIYRELNTQEQIILSKINLTTSHSLEGYLEYFEFIFDIMKNCIKNKTDYENLDFIEFVMLLTKIRSISIGTTIELSLENKESEIKNQKININLNYFIKKLYDIGNLLYLNDFNVIDDYNIKIKIKMPAVKNLKIFCDENIREKYNDGLIEFIDYVEYKNKKLNFCNFNHKQKNEFFDKIPIKIKQIVENKIITFLKFLSDENLLGLDQFKDQKFGIYNLGFVYFLRLFFCYDIKTIFTEIHYMCNNGFTPEYIMNISPSERNLLINIINDFNKSKYGNSESGNQQYASGKSLEDLALEFKQ